MIINNSRLIDVSNVSKFAWSELRRFHNSQYCCNKIIDLHSVPSKHWKNAEKQAQQIRVCLAQAYEYYQAAEAVSLATKPTLLYYSIMHLALAEVLMKQSGDSSLDRARMEHRHHGLTANISGRFSPNLDLHNASERLRAEPMIWDSGKRRGTFELWHRTSRELPILGEWESRPHQQRGYRTVLGAADKRLPLVPESGLSLWDCIINLPCMFTHLAAENILPNYTRATCKRIDLDDGYELLSSSILTPMIYLNPYIVKLRSILKCLKD